MHKESIGQKRASLSALFSQKTFSKEIYEYFLTSDTQEKIYLKTFLHSASENIKDLYYHKLNNNSILKVKEYEKLALDKLNGEVVNVDSLEWFDNVTTKINLIQGVEHKVFDNILILVDKLSSKYLISLTQDEKNWINTHIVKVGVEQWSPVVFSNNGEDIDGIAGDYLKNIIEKTGLKVKIINDKWDNLLTDFKNKKIDLLPATYRTDERVKYGLYSTDYFKMKDYIYVKENNNEIKSLQDLNGKKLAIETAYGTIEKIQKKYPDIKLVFTKNLDDSINKVLNGEVDAFYEGQVVVEQKIKSELISGLKGIAQSSFSAPTLHLFSKIDEPILASILQKALDDISFDDKKELQLKWFSKYLRTKGDKELNIAFNFDRPPFMFGETSSKGIESDLVKEILQSRGYEIKISQMSKEYLEKILLTDNIIDGVSAVTVQDDELFYSDNFVSFVNYAITHKKDNIKIDSINDLAKIKFVAWKGAYNDLGKEFYTLFNPINGTAKNSYSDSTSQADDVRQFFGKKTDALIIDKTIFQWYKLKYKNSYEYDFHKIFPKTTSYPTAFKSKKVRDDFNIGLKEIKKNGRYAEIVQFYLEQDIQPLLDFTNLIANISGKFMFEVKARELEAILREFFQHQDIVHIEVFNKRANQNFLSLYKKDTLIITGEDASVFHDLPNIKKDIYFSNKGTPLYLGEIKIFYKKEFANKNGELVPNLNSYINLNEGDLKKVQDSYKKFGFN